MPAVHRLIKLAAKPIPAVISPKTHAILDNISVGTFLAGATWFWRRNKRAAIASLFCAGARLAVTALTDYTGRVPVRRGIQFHAHREIDLSIAAMTAAMPEFLGFKDEPERRFFQVHGALIVAANELTDYSEKRRRSREYSSAA